MIEKVFSLIENDYIHIPVHGGSPKADGYYYVEVWANGKKQTEIYIGITPPNTAFDFYVPLHATRFGSDEITLICREEGAPENLFDGILTGGSMGEEKLLYPNLYLLPYQ